MSRGKHVGKRFKLWLWNKLENGLKGTPEQIFQEWRKEYPYFGPLPLSIALYLGGLRREDYVKRSKNGTWSRGPREETPPSIERYRRENKNASNS